MEIWKDIIGYENKYQISNLGNVKSLNYNGEKSEKILKPTINQKGYLKISLTKNNICKRFRIQRLVATAFIPNPQGKLEVNHKDGNKLNNSIENLEWFTHSENTKHAWDFGLNKYSGKLDKSVLQISLDGFIINEFKSQAEAYRNTGISQGNIWASINGKRNHAGGYIWR